MREVIERLEVLERKWYANEISAEEFAYEVFDIKAGLKREIPREHTEFCEMICVCD